MKKISTAAAPEIEKVEGQKVGKEGNSGSAIIECCSRMRAFMNCFATTPYEACTQ